MDLAFVGVSRADLVRPSALDDGASQASNSPSRANLIAKILFSRRFVPTYNLVILVLLLIFTTWHWIEQLAIYRKARLRRSKIFGSKKEEAVIETWSSSSSSLEGNAASPVLTQKQLEETGERRPLLSERFPRRTSSRSWRPYHLFRSWLQYQPRPIPFVNKTLPTNAMTLFILAFVCLNAFYTLYDAMPIFDNIFPFADRCGLVFMVNLPLLYLLAAKNQPIRFLTGYSYESLNIFHRRLGEVLCLEALLHVVGMFVMWYQTFRPAGASLMQFLLHPLVALGMGAFVAYELLYLTSLGSFRQRAYEVFLATHIMLQIAGLVFLWFHYHTAQPYVAAALAIFLADRLLVRLWLKSSTHTANLSVLEDGETILVSANWDTISRKSVLLPSNMCHGWTSNDHVFITISALSHKHKLQAHPFTIFSAAPPPPFPSTALSDSHEAHQARHAWFTLLVRAQADHGFTHTLLSYARSHPKTTIRLDGPYGSSHALDLLSSSDTAILVAGGSGIAVAYPLLYQLLHPRPFDDDVETVATSQRRHSQRPRSVKLLFITHSAVHRSWLPAEKLQELQSWGLEVLMPPPTSAAGRPATRGILEAWARSSEGIEDYEGGRPSEDDQIGMVVSGPEGLVRDVRNAAAGMLRRGRRVRVAAEKFGW